MNNDLNIKEYMDSSPKFDKVNWWNLPDLTNLELIKFPEQIKKRSKFVTLRKLKKLNNKEDFSGNIVSIRQLNKSFEIKFPLNLKNKHYARLYALMISEGSHRTEFSLHVPEKEFHEIFKESIKNLISNEAANLIRTNYTKGVLRSRASNIFKDLIPIPSQIPYIIMKDKNLAEEYLRISFEAEGSPIFDNKHKRYIKLSRYVDITPFVLKEELPLQKRIYSGTLKKKYSILFEKIKNKPPKVLLGEQILLKYHFNIDSKLILEAIKNNKTDLRGGKITARWILLIYANNINKFIENISFITEKKKGICRKMLTISPQRPQYFAFSIMNKIQHRGIFTRNDFYREMKKLGYVTPDKYIWSYHKKGIITRISYGKYKIIYQPEG